MNSSQTFWTARQTAEQGDGHLLEIYYVQALHQVLLVKFSFNPQNSPIKQPPLAPAPEEETSTRG